jgi:hypothetical protein
MYSHKEYEDNLISDYTIPQWEKDLISKVKTADHLPFTVYDMVQTGYPLPDHGEMIPRFYGSMDEEKMHPPEGMWCKVDDVRKYLDSLPKLENE